MKTVNENNASTSARTSEQKPPDARNTTDRLSESEFLHQQAEQAGLALKAALAEIQRKAGDGVNPVEWAREYPLISLGVAVVAGFVGAAALIPSKEQQALNRLAEIERALTPKPHKTEADEAENNHKDEKSRSLGKMLLSELIGVIKPMLISIMTAGLSSVGTAAAVKKKEDAEAAAAEKGSPR